mmetsp:Transcript_87953/g.247121  ORF Transcript_87953/g.247121 Transcript_87953/m.247121 type:complete len:100 (+) Transcript_87953:2606-2905(+)
MTPHHLAMHCLTTLRYNAQIRKEAQWKARDANEPHNISLAVLTQASFSSERNARCPDISATNQHIPKQQRRPCQLEMKTVCANGTAHGSKLQIVAANNH